MLKDRDEMKLFKPQQEKGFIPDVSNIVSTFPEKELPLLETEGPGFEIKDGHKSNGWTYSIDKERVQKKRIVNKVEKIDKYESVMRVKPNPNHGVCPKGEQSCPLNFDNKPDPKLLKQWLVWKHQATVMFVKPPGTVITFDTSGSFHDTKISGLTPLERSLGSLIGNKNIFVGFAPGQSKDLSLFLEEKTILNQGGAPPDVPTLKTE
jgi:hypothetical protein